ncbi:5'-nucleotidase SurE [Spirochaetia bacterium]|nr:5'-nucleotidase SurE [Spirochaetia bacterium]
MNIFVTNDDGIASDGLLGLVEALRNSRKDDRIFVIAPDSNRSAISNAVSFFHEALKLKPYDENTWSCSGTPADCALMSIMGALGTKPDCLISGINRGANLGTDLIYSGTAAAARQAALSGIPAVALSLAGHSPFVWRGAIDFSIEHFDDFLGYWKPDTFVNVNFPNLPDKPEKMLLTLPSRQYYNDELVVFDAPNNRRYCFVQSGTISSDPGEGTDAGAVGRGLVSVSSIYIHPVTGTMLR